MNEDASPEILPMETEQEVLYSRLVDALGAEELALRPELTVADAWDCAVAPMAVTRVLRALRVMSARQVAVLLAQEANRHSHYVIREPPHYSTEGLRTR